MFDLTRSERANGNWRGLIVLVSLSALGPCCKRQTSVLRIPARGALRGAYDVGVGASVGAQFFLDLRIKKKRRFSPNGSPSHEIKTNLAPSSGRPPP